MTGHTIPETAPPRKGGRDGVTQTQGERRVEYMPLDQIARAPRNPKGHDSDGIRESISAFGLADLPVLDDRTGRLVSGHGRLDDLTARHDAGETPPDGITTSDDGTWLVPVIRGWSSRSDQEAEAYLLYANQSTVKGGWDQTALGQMLTDLAAYDERLLALAGWTPEEIPTPAVDPGPPDDFPEYDADTIDTEHECPACGYKWSGKSGG